MVERKPGLAVAPADDERLDEPLTLRPNVEKPGALRRAEPFVAVPGVDVGAQPLEVERHVTRAVRAVDHREHPGLARPPAELLHREEKRRGRADVADEEDARLLRGGGPDRVRVDAGCPHHARAPAVASRRS